MPHSGHVTVTKIYEFAYAHRLPSYQGKCAQLHGHTGRLEVEVCGGEAGGTPYPGIVVDFHDLKRIMAAIVAELDHAFLNDVLNDPRFAGLAEKHLPAVRDEEGRNVYAPTSENMVRWVAHRLHAAYPGLQVVRIRWWESSTSYAEWKAC